MRIQNSLRPWDDISDHFRWDVLPDDMKEDFEKEVFEREKKAFLEGRTTAEQFESRIIGEAYSMYRIAHMFRDGIGLPKDVSRYHLKLQAAYTKGCGMAGWELLEAPETPGERLVSNPRTNVVSAMSEEHPKKFLREAEVRSAEHPEVAAAVIFELRPKGKKFDTFYALAGGSFRADILYCTYREHRRARKDRTNALELLEEAWDAGNLEAGIELGKVYFIGDIVPADRTRSERYFRSAADKGTALAKDWLAMFGPPAPRDGPLVRGPEPDDRTDGRYRMPYPVPRAEIEGIPEWNVLTEICRRTVGPDRTYSNGTFEIKAYDIECNPTSDPSGYERPKFRFKPTGYEMSWNHFPFDNACSNRPLDVGGIRRMLRLCIQSAIAPEGVML